MIIFVFVNIFINVTSKFDL